MNLQAIVVVCQGCGTRWRQPYEGPGVDLCMSCLAVMWKSGSFTENSFNPVPLNLDILFSEFPDIPSIAGTIFPMLKTPSTTAHSTSTMDVNEGRSPFGFDGSASLWIDRAIVEKYYRSGRFLPFEVIRRQTMLQNFDNYSMPLRSAMCALSAILSAPPAPVEVVDRYYGEARRQMMESLEHSPTIETAQTALMLALISMLLGKYPAVFMLAGMAVRMMSYLHLDTTEALQSLGHLSEDQRDAIVRCFWVCFSVDRFLSVFSNRPAQMAPNQSSILLLNRVPRGLLPDSVFYNLPLEHNYPTHPSTLSPSSPPNMPGPPPTPTPSLSSQIEILSPDTPLTAGSIGAADVMYQDIDNHKSPFASPLPNPSTDNLPHIFFAGRIMGILHDITRDIDVCGEDEDDAYGSLKRDDQGELGPRRFERDARFEVRLDEWYRDIPEGLRVSPEIAEAGLSVRQFAISSIEGARVREKSALDDGLGCSDSKTAMKFMLHIMYQTCVLQLHRPRVRLRRMAIGRERAWCLRGRASANVSSGNSTSSMPLSPPPKFNVLTSRRLDRSMRLSYHGACTILGILDTLGHYAPELEHYQERKRREDETRWKGDFERRKERLSQEMELLRREQKAQKESAEAMQIDGEGESFTKKRTGVGRAKRLEKEWKILKEDKEKMVGRHFDIVRKTPVNAFAIAISCLCLLETWVCVGWAKCLRMRGGVWGGDRVTMDQPAIMGSWIGEEDWEDGLVDDVIEAMGIGIGLMEGQKFRVGGDMMGCGTSRSFSEKGKEIPSDPKLPSSSITADERWLAVVKSIVDRHRKRLGGAEWDLEEEEKFLEQVDGLLEKFGNGVGRVPFGGILGAGALL